MSNHDPIHTLVLATGAQIRRTAAGRAALDLRLAFRQRWFDRKLAGHYSRRVTKLTQRGDVRLNIGSSTIYVEGWSAWTSSGIRGARF